MILFRHTVQNRWHQQQAQERQGDVCLPVAYSKKVDQQFRCRYGYPRHVLLLLLFTVTAILSMSVTQCEAWTTTTAPSTINRRRFHMGRTLTPAPTFSRLQSTTKSKCFMTLTTLVLSAVSNSAEEESSTPTSQSSTMTPIIWNFRNKYECYSEVSKPTGGKSSSSSAPVEVVLIHGFGVSGFLWRETVASIMNLCNNDDDYSANGKIQVTAVHALDLLGQGRSSKPSRSDGITYSIDLWAEQVNDYIEKHVDSKASVVLIGNSLGSLVALTIAATTTMSNNRIRGIGMYNCGGGMNGRNILNEIDQGFVQKILLTGLFDLLDQLIFKNIPFLTFLLQSVVSPEVLKNVLVGLYSNNPDPQAKVDDVMIDSIYQPSQDPNAVDALSQIYTNDPGKSPMELHKQYPSKLINDQLPIHVIWGSDDGVAPLDGPVGQLYSNFAADDSIPSVTMQIVKAGHIPFDEVPECNESMMEWLKKL